VPAGKFAVYLPTADHWDLHALPEPEPEPEPIVPPPPTVEQRIASLQAAVQAHLDQRAGVFGYDDIRTAVTYADEPAVPKFQAEGQALRAWRSLVWAACYDLLGQWKAGEAEEPTADELIAALPLFETP